MNYYEKYMKYKEKYLNLKHLRSNQKGGRDIKQSSIYIVKRDKTHEKIGEISNDSVHLSKTIIPSVDAYNTRVLTQIRDLKKTRGYILLARGVMPPDVLDPIRVEDIIGQLIIIYKWRRCTAFVYLQTSQVGKRIMVYLDDEYNHSGESFGTDCYGVISEDFIKDLKSDLDRAEVIYGVRNLREIPLFI